MPARTVFVVPFLFTRAARLTRREIAALAAFEDAMVAAGVRLVDADTWDDDEYERRAAAFRAAVEAWMRAQGWRAPRRRSAATAR
jgi:hypothetical protein